ncbi:MAG TPA: hypothetical protein DC047_03885 [Blastocatellia bacterium]|nr:hypothetical protein [Blastocatellia bacterium]
MDDQSPVQFIACGTADEFLDSLSPRGKYFVGEHDSDSYVFRGHGDQRYQLLPTALRFGKCIYTSTGWRKVGDWTNEIQIRAELSTIERFFGLADLTGLPLPEDSQALRDSLFDLQFLDGDLRDWPPQNLLSLIALAQHYGIPTRLLDWFRNAFIAAYFAAIEAAKWGVEQESSGVERLAVWAFKAIGYDLNRIASYKHRNRLEKIRMISVITAPEASNTDLHAQRGVFTLCRSVADSLEAPAHREPMDEVVKNLSAQDDIHNNLIEFSLPISESPSYCIFSLARMLMQQPCFRVITESREL